MASHSEIQTEIADLLVSLLYLEVTPSEIVADEPLFGDESPLGLDSIDALELAIEIGDKYGFDFDPEDEGNLAIFASLLSLSRHVEENRTR